MKMDFRLAVEAVPLTEEQRPAYEHAWRILIDAALKANALQSDDLECEETNPVEGERLSA